MIIPDFEDQLRHKLTAGYSNHPWISTRKPVPWCTTVAVHHTLLITQLMSSFTTSFLFLRVFLNSQNNQKIVFLSKDFAPSLREMMWMYGTAAAVNEYRILTVGKCLEQGAGALKWTTAAVEICRASIWGTKVGVCSRKRTCRLDARTTKSLAGFESACFFWGEDPWAIGSDYTGNGFKTRSAEGRVGTGFIEPDF